MVLFLKSRRITQSIHNFLQPYAMRIPNNRNASHVVQTNRIAVIATLLCSLFMPHAEAAIAFRAASTAYFQGTNNSGTLSPTVAGVGTAVTAASGSVTVPMPAGVMAGDKLICVVESHDNTAPSTPTGWSRLYRNRPGTEYGTFWSKTAVGGDASVVFTRAASSGSVVAQCLTVRGASNAVPVFKGAAGSGANVVSETVKPTYTNELLLMVAHLNQGVSSTQSVTSSAGLTWTQNLASTTSLGTGTPVPGSSIGVYSALSGTAGTKGPVTVRYAGTINAATLNYGALVSLKPAMYIDKPAGTIAGDLMLLSIAARSSTATITPPAGWTLLLNNTQSTNTRSRLATYYKFAGASEPASYAWSTGTIESVASLTSFSGVSAATPFDGVTPQGLPNSSSTLTQTAPDITPVSADDWLVTVHEQASSPCTGRTNGWTPPAGMTERTDVCNRTPNTGSGIGMEVNTQALTTPVATGTKIATAAARAARGISQSMVLRSELVAALDHFEIVYPNPPFSTCVPTTVTVYACADATCASYYTGGVTGITLSPGGSVVSIPAGSSTASVTVSQAAAGTATLNVTASTPAEPSATTCRNSVTNATACNVTFSIVPLVVTVANHVAGNTVTGSVAGCTTYLPAGANAVNFFTTYQNPGSGTKQASVNGTPIATSSPGTTVSITANGASPTSTGTFTLSYPDVGLVTLTAATATSTGNGAFITKPDRFAVTNIKCTSATAANCAAGAMAMGTPGTNPAAGDATGGAFMRAGNALAATTRFTATVTALTSAVADTPATNFGQETSAEGAKIASALISPAGGDEGILSCNGSTTACVIPGFKANGVTRNFSNGATTITDLAWNEVGVIQITPTVADGSYLDTGDVATPTASGNIGRFIPDHFIVTPDPVYPVRSQSNQSALPDTTAVGNLAGDTVIDVADVAGFTVDAVVRIPGAGAGGNAYVGVVTAINTPTLQMTVTPAIATLLDPGTPIIADWGTYMGQSMEARFVLTATDINDNTTQNYLASATLGLNYAKLNTLAAGNPLGLGAVDATGPTYNLNLTVAAASGSFTATDPAGAGNATIAAPITAVRGASPSGPFNAVKIGIAPTDSDGVKMGGTTPYDLGVASAALSHTSIMNSDVQDVTALRYGRWKIDNAYGSERLPLPMKITAQYHDGTKWVTNLADSLAFVQAGNMTVSNVGTLTSCAFSPLSFTDLPLLRGVTTFTLPAPGLACSANVANTQPNYLAGAPASTSVLSGNPGIAGRATFGIFKSPLIYRRENY
jgi:hypothetical protein